MDLLIAGSAAERLGAAIASFAPHMRLLRLGRTGDVRVDDQLCAAAEIGPEVAWLSLDIFSEALLPRFIDLVERSTGLRWLQTVHAGLDLPLYADLLVRKVRLCNSHVHAPAIAEYVMGRVLALFQAHDEAQRYQRERRWQPMGFRELGQSRWLVVGVGHVGTEIARRALAFGAAVIGVRRRALPHAHIAAIVPFRELPACLPDADVVVLACPLDAETRGLADSAFFEAMKPGAIFVNVARGGLVDEGALCAGLACGRPGFAVLDVTAVEPLPVTSPLWVDGHVRLTAHSAFAGSGTGDRSDRLFLENLRRYCESEPLLEEVAAI